MKIAIHLQGNETLYVEGESLRAVHDAIDDLQVVRRWWYSSAGGDRWEEDCLICEPVRYLSEETDDPIA